MLSHSNHENVAPADPAPTLTLEINEDFIYAIAIGRRTRATVAALTEEIGGALVKHRVTKVLVDVRQLVGWLTMVDSYYIVRDHFAPLRGRGIQRAAIVDRPAPPFHDRFLELVARNRGFKLRIFEDSQQAILWLRASRPTASNP